MKKFETLAGRTIITRFTDSSRIKTNRKRKPKQNPTPAAVAKINAINQERDLTAKINANFRNGDRWLTFSHPEVIPVDNSMEMIKKAKKKLQRLCKKAGIPFRCIESTGIGSQSGKPHHHLIVNQEVPWDLITKCWPEAEIFERRLIGEGNYNRVARYMLKNACETKDKRGKHMKAYRCSRSIVTPETRYKELTREPRLDPEDLPVRKGFHVDPDSIRVYEHVITGATCVEYIQVSLEPQAKPRRMSNSRKARPEPYYTVDWGDQLDMLDIIEF